MAYILTLLRNFWASLMSYLQVGKHELKSGENQLEKQVTECKQAKKQLQQTSNLLASLLLQVVTEYRQTETQLKNAISENESLKQTVQELQQKSATLERESDEARKTSTKVCLENTLLEEKVEQLESHKKVLIQELSGSPSSQDIEFITWEFLIQKVKEVTNQLNEVIAHNQSLIKIHRDLHQEKEVLSRELNQVKDNNTRLTQDNSQFRANEKSLESELRRTLDRIKPLERGKDKLEQEKAQIERKLYELNQEREVLSRELNQVKDNNTRLTQDNSQFRANEKSLESELRQTLDRIKPLERDKDKLEQEKAQIERKLYELNPVKSKLRDAEAEVEQLEEVEELKQNKKNLETELKQEKVKVIFLEQKVKGLEAVLERENNGLSRGKNICDEIDLLEQYNNLVYWVQESLNLSGIEELKDWEKTEEFYIEIISKLCFIDTMLITKIESLESESIYTITENSYLGKFLFWSNGEVRWELSSLFNSKL